MKTTKSKICYKMGTITPAVLIIIGAFVMIIYGLLMVLSLQLNFSHRQTAAEEALGIAEAGINYYRWHLAHAPEDFKDGQQGDGPYIHDYYDPQGAKIGKYSLEIIPPEAGSSIVTISSTGWTNQYPNIKRKITASYGIPSFSQYAFLSNASSWYGTGITIYGSIHSNNGIRMDGRNYSYVTSAKQEYKCGSETGCYPPVWKPGVWGAGGDQSLWRFPVPAIDFDSISFDYKNMRQAAIDTGVHLGDSNAQGYHIVFSANGSYQIFKVNKTNRVRGYSVPGQGLGEEGAGGCRWLDQIISSENSIGTYQIKDKPIIFAEDHLWVEGTIKGRVTVVAASFPIQSSNKNIWIKNNLVYQSYDGSNNLGLIAQNNIYFVRDVPDNFRIDGALIAQKGNIIRHGYLPSCGDSQGALKQKLTINGSLISYFKSYWNFNDPPISGFITREINYDTNLLYAPPPYFPTSGDYEFISWKEE
jgi:hypothetical protein